MANQINLVNPAFLKQRKIFSATAMAQSLAFLTVAILGFSGYLSYRAHQLEEIVRGVDARAKEQREHLLQFGSQFAEQRRSKLLAEELARAEARLKLRQELLNALLAEGLGNTVGFSRYLTAFARQNVSGVWLTAIRLDGDDNELAVEGRALHADQVPAYLRALSREDAMRGRQVESLKLTARGQAADAAAKLPALPLPSTAPAAAAPAPSAAPAPGVAPAPAEPAAIKGPARYVEFSLLAPRRIVAKEPPAPAAAPAPAVIPTLTPAPLAVPALTPAPAVAAPAAKGGS